MTKTTDLVLWKYIWKEKVQVCFLGFVCVCFGDPLSPGPSAGQPWGSSPTEAAVAGVGHCLGVNFEALSVRYLTASRGAAPPSRGGETLSPLCSAAIIQRPPHSEGPRSRGWLCASSTMSRHRSTPSLQKPFLSPAGAAAPGRARAVPGEPRAAPSRLPGERHLRSRSWSLR